MRPSSAWHALVLYLILVGAVCFAQPQTRELTLDDFRDKCLGAWAGQMIGVTYGDWSEFKWKGFYYEGELRPWAPEHVARSIGQDDCYVDMTFVKCLEDYGLNCTFEQAGRAFADSQYPLWHANRSGRDNCRNGIMPPLSGHYTKNPHFDCIDFQIESDFAGILCPGMPATCNKLCDLFGHVMNYGDGVYGGSFVGGMYAAAYFESDVEKVVRTGLANVPDQSFYAATIRDVLEEYKKNPDDPRPCWNFLEKKWGWMDHCMRDNPGNIDAKLNGAYIAIGLLWGKGDMDKTLEYSTRCGQDSDCNPSSAAGILGCILGYKGIPSKYTDGIPAIADRKFSFTNYSFNMLADVCAKITRGFVQANGGKIENRAGMEVWVIPVEDPKPLPLEQWFDVDFLLRPKAMAITGAQPGAVVQWREIPMAKGYRILRGEAGQNMGEVAMVSNASQWVDTQVDPAKQYQYAVQVIMPYGEREPTKPAAAGQGADVNALLDPTIESGVGPNATVTLRWKQVPGATGYRILRGEIGQPMAQVAEVGDVVEWTDTKAAPARQYQYAIQAVMPYGVLQSTKPLIGAIVAGEPRNVKGDENLALRKTAYADARVTQPTGSGLKDVQVIRNGNVAENYDSYDGDNKLTEDWYAIRFIEPLRVNRLVYVEGKNFDDGGWWTKLGAQYLNLQTGKWTDVANLKIDPPYNFEDKRENRKPFTRFVLTFDEVACAGVRIIGEPGGSADFTSIAELEVFYR